MKRRNLCLALSCAFLISCAAENVREEEIVEEIKPVPFESTYQPSSSAATLITNAVILTGTGDRMENASLLIEQGKISAVGQSIQSPAGAVVIDAGGKWLTPGLIDVHSHMGVYPSPSHEANLDGNEITSPNTAQVWAEHSVWTQDPQFTLALAGGITSMQILPGSANLFGGRSVTLKNIPKRTVQAMKFPGAPYGLKMACGENPKRVYGQDRKTAPGSRMANVAGYRAAWIEASDYRKSWDEYEQNKANGEDVDEPLRDLQLETLAEALSGDILVHIHCYRGEEMAIMLDVAREFGYKVTMFHHAVESYKIADILADNDVCSAMWPEWWGFKHEAYDMVEENVAMVDAAGACAVIHSDSPITIQHLNQEAAKVMAAANHAGYDITRAHAMKWITLNAAKSLGIDAQTGSLEPGKMADVVLWNGDPFSVYTRAEKVFIDGVMVFDRLDQSKQPVTDFDLGLIDPEGERL